MFQTFPVENRAQLIDDAFTLARRGNLSHEIAFNLISYIHKEDEFLPWDNVIDYTDYIAAMFRQSRGFGDLQVNCNYFRLSPD